MLRCIVTSVVSSNNKNNQNEEKKKKNDKNTDNCLFLWWIMHFLCAFGIPRFKRRRKRGRRINRKKTTIYRMFTMWIEICFFVFVLNVFKLIVYDIRTSYGIRSIMFAYTILLMRSLCFPNFWKTYSDRHPVLRTRMLFLDKRAQFFLAFRSTSNTMFASYMNRRVENACSLLSFARTPWIMMMYSVHCRYRHAIPMEYVMFYST